MKTRCIYFSVLFFLLVMGPVGCSNDRIDDGKSGNFVKGHFSLSVKTPNVTNTKTINPTVSGEVDEYESKINSVTLVFANDAGYIQQVIPGLKPSGEEKKTPVVEVPVGTYDIYAVVNPSGATAIHLVNGANINDVIQAASIAEIGGYANGGGNGFMMFNANDIAGKEKMNGQNTTITTANTAANPVVATIHVDRLVAAIRITKNDPEIVPNSFFAKETVAGEGILANSLLVDGFLPINILNTYNLIQAWSGDQQKNRLLDSNTPNGRNKQEIAFSFYNKVTDFTSFGAGQALSTTLKDVDFVSKVFVLENRPEIIPDGGKLTSYSNVATGVIFRITAINEIHGAKTFYRVKTTGKCYYDRNDAIAAANAVNGTTLERSDLDSDLRAGGIQVYENGAMYYSYFIKDKNYKASYPDYGIKNATYYAIHRNSVYNLAVNAISGLGADVPGGDLSGFGNAELIADTCVEVAIEVDKWIDNYIELGL